MTLPTFEPIGHAVLYAHQQAAGMMRNTETHELELRPHRYLRECDVLTEMRMIKDKLDEYEERQDAHNAKEAAAMRAQSEAMTQEGKLIEELKARIAVLEAALSAIVARAALAATEPRP